MNKKRTKLFLIITSLALLSVLLAGCQKTAPANEDDRLSVVATIFPEYDWVRNILGEDNAFATVTMLVDSGVDLHSYQPSADDIIRISECDLFIYVGGESDSWVNDALKETVNKNMVVLNLLDILGDAAKEEELVEGMEAEEEADHTGHESEEPEYDEHVWLSLKNAVLFVNSIKDALTGIDPEHADIYSSNAAAYTRKLQALDEEYRAVVERAPIRTLLFGDRFPFRYLTEDYGLEYFAAFSGCSAESEASFETIAFLADKLNELKLPAILTLDGSEPKIAETVLSTAKSEDLPILSLNSMQSVTSKDTEEGADYLSVMEENLKTLKTALRGAE